MRKSGYAPQTISFTDPSGKQHAIRVQRSALRAINSLDRRGHLSSRGWTFQENVLSKRVVHFTDVGVLWECAQGMVFEDSWPHEDFRDDGLVRRLWTLERDNNAIAASWRELVTSYSARDLTRASDRLPAISGIAAQVAKRSGLQYAAGLWKANLLRDLLWVTKYSKYSKYPSGSLSNDHPLPKLLQAPSWSWASIDGGISFCEHGGMGDTKSQDIAVVKDV